MAVYLYDGDRFPVMKVFSGIGQTEALRRAEELELPALAGFLRTNVCTKEDLPRVLEEMGEHREFASLRRALKRASPPPFELAPEGTYTEEDWPEELREAHGTDMAADPDEDLEETES